MRKLVTGGLVAFALVAVGGALGKAVFGRIGERFGVTRSVILTETGTAAEILLVVVLPLAPALRRPVALASAHL